MLGGCGQHFNFVPVPFCKPALLAFETLTGSVFASRLSNRTSGNKGSSREHSIYSEQQEVLFGFLVEADGAEVVVKSFLVGEREQKESIATSAFLLPPVLSQPLLRLPLLRDSLALGRADDCCIARTSKSSGSPACCPHRCCCFLSTFWALSSAIYVEWSL